MAPPQPLAAPAPQPPAPRGPGLRHVARLSRSALLSRALLYSLLAAYVGALFVVVVTRGGVAYAYAGANLPWWLALLALVLVAVTIVPVHGWLRRSIDRLIFDWHDDPYAVLAELNQRLDPAQPQALPAIVPTIAATIAATLRLPYVAITTNADGETLTGAYGAAPARTALLAVPLTYHGATIGTLHAAPRRPGETLSASDAGLLYDLARQVGVAVHAVRLTRDLERARARLVAAREEERRRLRRDLHDGLGPRLASLTLKLESLRDRLAHDPVGDAMVADLTRRTQDAVADIRRLVYALRPPALDDLGLVSALRESAAQYGYEGHGELQIAVEAPDELPPLPAAVEVAAFRIAQEALTNVVRHAMAHHCTVRLALDAITEALSVEVRDDGRGLSPDDRLVVQRENSCATAG